MQLTRPDQAAVAPEEEMPVTFVVQDLSSDVGNRGKPIVGYEIKHGQSRVLASTRDRSTN
jgi:hypothetical protein